MPTYGFKLIFHHFLAFFHIFQYKILFFYIILYKRYQPRRHGTAAVRYGGGRGAAPGAPGAPWGPKNIIFYIKIIEKLYFLYNIKNSIFY